MSVCSTKLGSVFTMSKRPKSRDQSPPHREPTLSSPPFSGASGRFTSRVGSILIHKNQTRNERPEQSKHSSLQGQISQLFQLSLLFVRACPKWYTLSGASGRGDLSGRLRPYSQTLNLAGNALSQSVPSWQASSLT